MEQLREIMDNVLDDETQKLYDERESRERARERERERERERTKRGGDKGKESNEEKASKAQQRAIQKDERNEAKPRINAEWCTNGATTRRPSKST